MELFLNNKPPVQFKKQMGEFPCALATRVWDEITFPLYPKGREGIRKCLMGARADSFL